VRSAETGLNVLKANVIPLLQLDDHDGVEYDIVSSRSCARGITAQNTFRIGAPAANMSMIYGIGGIGMTTMGANGLLLHALMAVRKELSDGNLTLSEYMHNLSTSNFGHIHHWPHDNPFKSNYLRFLDNASDPKIVARHAFATPWSKQMVWAFRSMASMFRMGAR